MNNREKEELKQIRYKISKIADKCAAMNQYIDSSIWDEMEEQLYSINRLIRALYDKPKPERKHCYCKDCAYFEYAEPINKTWYECTRSKYVKGCHKGELRHIMKSMTKCIDFLPAGENPEYHEGIEEVLNNIQIKESEEEE